ncbi:MAG: acyl-CoA thioesterase [Oscillospiraceae bacterium]|nr:acyl-CoA thioesterase [Oscillospiraceae bacterium]
MFIYQKIPQYYETDQMGIIHHSNHVRWFEEARLACMDALGIGAIIRDTDSGVVCPVLNVQVNYRKMIRLHDKIQIKVYLMQYNGFRYTFYYEICNAETDEICCDGTTALCFMTPENQPVRMKKAFPELHQILSDTLRNEVLPENCTKML